MRIQNEERVQQITNREFARGKEDALLGRDYGHNAEWVTYQPEHPKIKQAYIDGWNTGRRIRKG